VNLKAEREAAIKAARAIIDSAKADDRDLTPDEHTSVEAEMDRVKTLDVQLKGKALVDSVLSLGTVEDKPVETSTDAKTLGEHFAKSVGEEKFSRLKAVSGFTVSSPEYAGPVKAATDPLALTQFPNAGNQLALVDQTPVRAFRPGPVVADLFSAGAIGPNNNAVTYFVEGALEGDFAFVPELGQKPQLHVTDYTPVTDGLRKIAAWWDTSDEMVEDLPFMVSEINNRGLYRLGMFEEAALLSGAGTGSTIRGLLNRTGLQTEVAADGGGDNADSLFRAMTKVQTATGLTADGIVINPIDYQKLRLARDANEQYYGGGYFAGQYGVGGVPMQPPLWGMTTVVTAAVAAGTALVGAFRQAATVYRKGGVRVESTNSDQGKFTTNVITTRIEERVALAVRIPSAVVKVTLK
jgi:HK97 family phage major capsid protein